MSHDPLGTYRAAPVPLTLEDELPIDTSAVSPKPEGAVYEAEAQSANQGKSATAEARVRQTTKSAIAAYLQSYFVPGTARNHQLRLTAPFGAQFVTDISGAANPNDPTVINTQIARLWPSLRQKFPCVLIIDTSYQPKFSGAFGMERAERVRLPHGNDKQAVMVQKVLGTVGIQLMIASLSDSEASDLADLTSYILGPLTHFNRAHILESSKLEDLWEVRLPLTYGAAALERRNVSEDQRDSMWSSSLDLEVAFEGTVRHGINHSAALYNVTPGDGATVGVPEDPGLHLVVQHEFGCCAAQNEASLMSVAAPVEMNLREFPRIDILNLPNGAVVVSDDPRVAYIDSFRIVHPKSPGTFNLLVLQNVGTAYEPVVLYKSPQPIRVTV
jgi:hypothetical protein